MLPRRRPWTPEAREAGLGAIGPLQDWVEPALSLARSVHSIRGRACVSHHPVGMVELGNGVPC